MSYLRSLPLLEEIFCMCGRFTRFHTWSDIHRMYRLADAAETGRNTEARYNIAPTENVLFVTVGDNGNQKLREGRWWLVPWWAKEIFKAAMFNARSETADTSGAFPGHCTADMHRQTGPRLPVVLDFGRHLTPRYQPLLKILQ